MTQPYLFTPFLRQMVWGGRRLGEVLGKPLPDGRAYGESWEVSDHPLHRSVVANGRERGRTLRDLMECGPEALLGLGTTHRSFPLLVKFLDACDWLSVQVHPDEEAVKRLWPGEGSKTEAWFVLDAAPESRIYAGLREGVDRKLFRSALETGRVLECLHQFQPHPGDCVFLPAGTVHAVGGGVLIAEVQQTSDATFRLYDWDRCDAQGKRRELHVEQGVASIHWPQGPVRPVQVPDFAPGGAGSPRRQPLVRCRYFELEFVRETAAFVCGDSGRMQMLLVLGGRGTLSSGAGTEELRTGQTWLLPAALGPAEVRPHGGLSALLCTQPA